MKNQTPEAVKPSIVLHIPASAASLSLGRQVLLAFAGPEILPQLLASAEPDLDVIKKTLRELCVESFKCNPDAPIGVEVFNWNWLPSVTIDDADVEIDDVDVRRLVCAAGFGLAVSQDLIERFEFLLPAVDDLAATASLLDLDLFEMLRKIEDWRVVTMMQIAVQHELKIDEDRFITIPVEISVDEQRQISERALEIFKTGAAAGTSSDCYRKLACIELGIDLFDAGILS